LLIDLRDLVPVDPPDNRDFFDLLAEERVRANLNELSETVGGRVDVETSELLLQEARADWCERWVRASNVENVPASQADLRDNLGQKFVG